MPTQRAISIGLALVVACGSEAAPATPSGPATEELGAMTEYLRRSKTAEAKVRLRAIATGMEAAAMEEHVGQDGTVERRRLVSAPLTPPAGACCKHPGHRCPPGTGDWTHPTWQAIAFEVADPHYYAYELVIEETGFVARAVGDLDCDGELATFELRGKTKPDGGYEIASEPTSDDPLE